MPENTRNEFQKKNKYGHRSKNDKNTRNRSSSPPRKIGNVKSHRNYCTHCNPSLACRMERKFQIYEEIQKINKEIKL